MSNRPEGTGMRSWVLDLPDQRPCPIGGRMMTAKAQVRGGILRGPGQLTLRPAHSPNLDKRSEPMPERTCSVDGCSQPVRCRGLCRLHERRWRQHGDPQWEPPRPTPAERFWIKVEKTDTCWLWVGAKDPNGYGRFRGGRGRSALAHRFAYELEVGPIPEGLTLDHLCRVVGCVRPEHLEPVTVGENVLRGETVSALNARKERCIRGHEFTPENTYIVAATGKRQCRTCNRLRDQKRRSRS